MSLLDAWMPDADVAASYDTHIRATVPQVYEALLATDFGSHPLVALLMGLRAIPAFLTAPRSTCRRLAASRRAPTLRLKTMLSQDFVILQEEAPHEMVLGLTGRFWTPSGGLIPTQAATFRDAPPIGTARAAWNFTLEPAADGGTRLATETRVRCGDPATARSFRWYWRLVAPGSGLIRWVILRQVRLRAEEAEEHETV